MAPKVLVADKLSRLALDIFARRGIDAHVKTDLTRDELIEIISGYDGLAVRSATKVTEKVVAAARAAQGHRAGRHRRRQCRPQGRNFARHHRHEHAVRQLHHYR